MKINVKIRILEKANELINSIACGSKPTARCKPQKNVWLTLRKVSQLIRILLIVCLPLLVLNCKDKPDNSEVELKAFLISEEGTYGWVTNSDNISLDFFEDGKLVIQGPEGEATMWEGRWQLLGDQLTLDRVDLEPAKKETLKVKIDGENLILDDKIYTRYAP